MKNDSNKPVFIASRAGLASALGIDYWVARRRLAGAPANQKIVALHSLAGSVQASVTPAATAAGRGTAEATSAGSAARNQLLRERSQLVGSPSGPKRSARAGTPRNAHHNDQRKPLSGLPLDSPSSDEKSASGTRAGASGQAGLSGRANTTATPDALRFEIASVAFGSLLIADDVTGLSLTRSNYLSWLQALVFAMQVPAADAATFKATTSNATVARLSWPPANSLPASASANNFDSQRRAAAEMLSAWLHRQAADVGIARILLMGDAPQLLVGDAKTRGALLQMSLFPGATVCVTHGSNRLWREPGLKRELWQHLQQLM